VSVLTELRAFFRAAIITAYPEAEAVFQAENTLSRNPLLEITPSTQPTFGDYQFNSAMRLSKLSGNAPRDTAAKIIAALPHNVWIERCEIAGPGFINIHLTHRALSSRVLTLLSDNRLGIPSIGNQKRVIVDFSSPNVAKEMHVGHLRSTIIGDSLARLFEFFGYDVLRLNHIGDWGTAFGMLIAYFETHPNIDLTKTDAQQLTEYYRSAKACFDQDDMFKESAHQAVVALQSGDAVALALWKQLCDISRKAFQSIYALLNIQLIERGESFYNPSLAPLVQRFIDDQVAVESEGALCVFSEGFIGREGEPLPLMIRKSDGAFNYATTDLAALDHRIHTERAARIIYVTDAGQSLHFQMVFAAAQRVGIWDSHAVRLDHVPFGLVLGADGKKFRTRSGETEKLSDLLIQAVNKAKEILTERNSTWSQERVLEAAHVLGINAVKYADLSTHRTSDYAFSYDKMLRFEGNTAAFVLYALVRICSIERRVSANLQEVINQTTMLSCDHSSELGLMLQLIQFEDVLLAMQDDLLPHRLAEYLYKLAESFNAFFRDCRVEGVPEQNQRLVLCECTRRVFEKGLSILGLTTLTEM